MVEPSVVEALADIDLCMQRSTVWHQSTRESSIAEHAKQAYTGLCILARFDLSAPQDLT